jgi:hypothetical protein
MWSRRIFSISVVRCSPSRFADAAMAPPDAASAEMI